MNRTDQTSKYAATRITSLKNTCSLQEMLTPAEIRSQRRIICNTQNTTSDLLPLRTPRKRSRRAVSSGRQERTRTTWTMTAILARCRIVSPRLPSGRALTRNRNKDSNRNRVLRQTPRNRSATDPLTSPSVRAATIAGALRPGRIVRATDFRTEVRDPIARSKSATTVIATIDTDATVVRGITGPTAILSRRVKPAPRRRRRPGFRPS
jgi:hypothetical protein